MGFSLLNLQLQVQYFVNHCLSFCLFFFWPLHCLSFFELRLHITPLVSSSFSCKAKLQETLEQLSSTQLQKIRTNVLNKITEMKVILIVCFLFSVKLIKRVSSLRCTFFNYAAVKFSDRDILFHTCLFLIFAFLDMLFYQHIHGISQFVLV